MTNYSSDRNFTDFVHKNLALNLIYKELAWQKKEISKTELESMDMNLGIDYIFENSQKQEQKVQERFRDNYYQNYNDCTLRYRRDNNANKERQASEFYKIKADYLVYGITNGSKFPEKRNTLTDFLKYVVLDIKILYEKIEKGLIIPEYRKSSIIKNEKMIAAVQDNKDDSSSFIAFDVAQLHQLFGKEGIIVLQKGYF